MPSIHDNSYYKQVRKIYQGGKSGNGGIINDKIKMSRYNSNRKTSREEILDHMLERHNHYIAEGALAGPHILPCAQFLGAPPLDRDRILDKLFDHTGHASLNNWNHWRGKHTGRWIHNHGGEFTDNANWGEAYHYEEHADGTPYNYQQVVFLNSDGTVKRRGWNQSHPHVDYLWGYDPKPGAEHVGIKFRQGGQRGIFWFTRRECYLEIIYNDRGTIKRTSTGLDGVGQWLVDPNWLEQDIEPTRRSIDGVRLTQQKIFKA